MIIIDTNRCTGCGQCLKICHEHCITMVENYPHVNLDYCSTCTQCIAVCPEQAVTWDGVEAIPFDREKLPDAVSIKELLQERRSIRFFTEKKIDKRILLEIAKCGSFSPTNNFSLRVLIIDDEQLIRDVERIVYNFAALIHNLVYKSNIIFNTLRWFTRSLLIKDRIKFQHMVSRGRNFHTFPSAIMMVIGDAKITLSEASAQLSLYNMSLYAQSTGLGCCFFGPAKVLLNRSRQARKLLKVNKKERILGALLLGYPAVRFCNKVEGKYLPIQWNS